MNFTPPKDSGTTKTVEPIKYSPVTDYMAKDVFTFHPDQNVQEAIDLMLEKRISGGPVLNDSGELVGMLSEKDCLRIIIDSAYHNQPNHEGKVKNYMSRNVKTMDIDKDIFDVANEFLTTHFRRFPVIDSKGVLKGQISRRDIMKAARDLKGTTW